MHLLENLNGNKYAVAAKTDLSKAFDLENCDIMLRKLFDIGIWENYSFF